MKIINFKTVTILSIISTLVICSFTYITIKEKNSNNEGVTFTIATDKTYYLESEPVWLIMDVIIDKNFKLDRKPILYPESDIDLTLLNSKGDTMKYVGGFVEALAVREYPDTMLFVDNLFYFFGEPERFPNSRLVLQYYIPEGNYTLSAVLKVSINNSYKTFQSNTVSFVIAKATGEELKAYEKWLEIWNAIMKNSKDIDYIGDLGYNFLEQYPHSAYTERTRSILLGAGRIHGDRKTFITNAIKDNPDNGYNRYYLSSLESIYKDANDKSGFIKFLNEMKDQNRGTLLDKIVRNRISEIKTSEK